MKNCLLCSTLYVSSIRACPSCSFIPTVIDGFDSYAPDFAYESNGFKSSYFSELAHLEEGNFWFHARNQLILHMLKQYHPNFQSFLEIGCGTGYVLSSISKQFPNATFYGSEIFIEGLNFAAMRVPSANFIQMDAKNIPFKEEFSAIGAFDVLEHIEEDEQVLTQVWAALKFQGFLFITVPQHPWLWSSVDEHACHFRRYSALELHKKIKAAGFSIVRSTSFMSILLPAMIISRFLQKKSSSEKFDPLSELKISPWLNSLFSRLIYLEQIFLNKNFNFSIGGSRFVVAKKI